LKKEGVEVIFGYPGGAILPTFDAIYDSGIRFVLPRHEQGAAHMADGYARVSGKVGVCMATSGPGATNLATGLATANMDSVLVDRDEDWRLNHLPVNDGCSRRDDMVDVWRVLHQEVDRNLGLARGQPPKVPRVENEVLERSDAGAAGPGGLERVAEAGVRCRALALNEQAVNVEDATDAGHVYLLTIHAAALIVVGSRARSLQKSGLRHFDWQGTTRRARCGEK
jgi:hypothetical protein